MKVIFKYGIRTYSGTIDEMVYGSYRDDKLCTGREYVYPTLTAQNTLIGNVATNLRLLWDEVSEGYRDDLKAYALRNASENIPKTRLAPTAYALYIKLMYGWQKADPEHVDLEMVTNEDITALGSTISTVKNCIDNGYLDSVSVYDDLVAAI